MFDTHDLLQCRSQELSSCDPAALVDLRDIKIDAGKPITERVQSFMEQVGNPYLFKVGDIAVKVNYGDGKPLADVLASLVMTG